MNRVVEGHGVVTIDAIQLGQKERTENNKETVISQTSYRDYGNDWGLPWKHREE